MLVFLLLSFKSYLYILDNNLLSVMSSAHIFFSVCGLSSKLLFQIICSIMIWLQISETSWVKNGGVFLGDKGVSWNSQKRRSGHRQRLKKKGKAICHISLTLLLFFYVSHFSHFLQNSLADFSFMLPHRFPDHTLSV